MANTIITSDWVLKEIALGYLNQITFVANLMRSYDDQYKQNGAHVGNTVNVRMPQRFEVKDGQALQVQDIYDSTVPITLTNQKHVGMSWSSAQATTEIDDARGRYVTPAAEAIANACDVLAWQDVYRSVYNSIGTPGAGPLSTTMAYLEAGVKLTDLCTPQNGRVAVLDPMAMATIANSATTLFNPSAKVSEAFTKGMFGRDVLGISEWFQDSNRPVHTTGTYTACSPAVNGATQTGSTLITDGWASGASSLKAGDTFTIAGVYSVNPLSYQSTGRLQDFVVTAATSDSGGAMATLPISPPIITSGQLQTVSGSPADNAIITVRGATDAVSGTLATTASIQSMLFVKEFAAFVMADLSPNLKGASVTQVQAKKWAISMRMVEQYNILTDQNPSRLDVLIGAASLQPRLAVRIYQ